MRLKHFVSMFFMLFALSVGQVWATSPATITFSEKGLSNDTQYSDPFEIDDNVTITFGGGNNDGKYYNTGTAIRTYGNGTITIAATNGTITQVVFTWSGNSYKPSDNVANVGAYSTGNNTWTGSASSVTLTRPSGSGHWRLQGVTVTYTSGGSTVAVSGVTLDKNAITLDEEATQTLTATVLPTNATNKNVTWESDDESVATVANGVVTAVGGGDATITCKSVADDTKSATCSVHVNASPYTKSKLIFTAECGGSGTADDDAEWTITSDGAESVYDATSGIHYGTGKANVTYLQLATSSIEGSVARVVVNARDAQATATISVTVGGTAFTCESATATNTSSDYSFTGTGSGEIVVRVDRGSSMSKAIYVKSIVVYYTPAAIKTPAGLAYVEADQKKLVKLGDAFTAPALTNPNNLTVSYASDNTDVAEVAANGTVTIKAVGVAEITASFAGNDDYKSGDASYTIGVTSHAGTSADPYIASDVKTAIDVMGTVENAYASGIVSNVVTTTLPEEKYITFFFSADGATTGQQIEAYKCYDLNSAQFEAVGDVTTGATVVVTGNLKKYNSTYEFDQNCHLVSYTAPTAPKEHITNEQANPYSVAQAITYAADGVTYDLDDYVYVQGVVYDVKSFDNGVMNIFIKDANAENQFELYKCAGINDGNTTTPFEALTDVKAGNIVIGYGQLTVYNNKYEFKQGNYIVDLQKPATGIELDATAEVEKGSTVNLTATILPSNATGTIVWTVESGNDKASVAAGVVTGIEAGEATIRATVQGTEIYAECTVTVTAALTNYYEKVTSTADIEEGTYLIVYEAESVAFNGGLDDSDNDHKLDKVSNTIAVDITAEHKIGVTNATAAATFYIDPEAGTIQSASGKYIGVTSNANGLKTSDNASAYFNSFEIDDDGNAIIGAVFSESTMTLRYNTDSGQKRFRYFKTTASPAGQLYKLQGEAVKSAAGLAWNPAEDITLTVGDAFTAPSLTNPNSIDAADITIESSNTDVATVTEGVVELVENATGTTTITATFAGNASYKPATVSYKITVNPAYSIDVNKQSVNFGTVTSGASVADQKITVTLTNVASVTATLDGTNADAFSISPESLTESGDITISFIGSTDTEASYAATLTISDGPEGAEDKMVDLSLTIEVGETAVSTSSEWVVATEVADGMEVLITGVKSGVTYAISEQATNNRTTAAGTLNEGVFTPGDNTMSFTLVAQDGGKYALRTSNGKYLYAASSSSNHLKTRDAVGKDGKAVWTISIGEENVASIVANCETANWRNTMQFNQNGQNNPVVACYASANQSAIKLYVPYVAPTVYTVTFNTDGGSEIAAVDVEDGQTVAQPANPTKDDYNFVEWQLSGIAYDFATPVTGNITLDAVWEAITPTPSTPDYVRNVTSGQMGTICLPNAVAAGDYTGATMYSIAYKTSNPVSVELVEENEGLVAGRPYIFIANANKIEVNYTGDAVNEAGHNNGLYGCLEFMVINYTVNIGDYAKDAYMLSGGKIKRCGTNCTLQANRAYIVMDNVPEQGGNNQQIPGRRYISLMVEDMQTPTALDEVTATEENAKFILNGQLYILRDGKLYNAQGQLVK